MQLSDEQKDAIEVFGGLNYPPRKIAIILGINTEEFLLDFNHLDTDPDYESSCRYHYDKGMFQAQAVIDKANFNRAKDGNLTSLAQYKKDISNRELENAKLRTVFNQEQSFANEIKALISTGQTQNLSPVVVKYIDQIDYIRSLYLLSNSRVFIINQVKTKWPQLTKVEIGKLYNDTMNYFYEQNDIKKESWRNMYAEQCDNMAKLAIAMTDVKMALECVKLAVEIRGVNKDTLNPIPDELLDQRPILYTMDIELLGIPSVKKKDLTEFIEKLNLSSSEITRIKRDAMIIDTPFEIMLPEHGTI